MSKKNGAAKKKTFEECLGELEEIVSRIEGDELTLDESLSAHEKGVGLLRACQDMLARAEMKIKELTEEDGRIKLADPGEPPEGGEKP